MKYLGQMTLKVTDINIGERLRQIDEAHAEMLAESLHQTGRLRNRPEVRQQKKGKSVIYTLIAGGHRMRAIQIVEWNEVEVDVYEGTDDEVRLWEIDENLVRHELNPLDRAIFLAERKDVYERLHPEAKRGGDRKSNSHGDSSIGFAKATAERINNLSEATIFRAVAIAKGINAAIRQRIAGTGLAHKQSELLALTKLSPAEQNTALDLLLAEEPKAKTVDQAMRIIRGVRAPEVSANDQAFDKLIDLWRRTPQPAKRAFLRHLQETDVLAELLGDGEREAA